METNKKPVVRIGNLNGPDGNIFVIAGKAREALLGKGDTAGAKELTNKLMQQESYELALILVKDYVDLRIDK